MAAAGECFQGMPPQAVPRDAGLPRYLARLPDLVGADAGDQGELIRILMRYAEYYERRSIIRFATI